MISARRLLPHVADATGHAEQLGAAGGTSVRLLNTVAATLVDYGQLGTVRPLLDRALRIAQAALGPGHPDTMTTRGNLASWLGEAGQVTDAIIQFRQLLDDRTRVLGARSPRHPGHSQ